MSQRPESIPLDQVTEAAVSGVLRAIKTHKQSEKDFDGTPWLPGPILVGIIWWPERLPGEFPMAAGGGKFEGIQDQ